MGYTGPGGFGNEGVTIPWEMQVWCQPCRAGKEKALLAGGVCSPQARGPSPPTSVTAFLSLWPGLEQDLDLSFHLDISFLGILRDTPGQAAPSHAKSQPHGWGVMGCHQKGTQQASPATHPMERGLGRVTSMSACHPPLAPHLIPEKQMPSCPCGCLPLCAAAASPRSQPGRKTNKNLPASAKQHLPFASAEVYWHSQHGALSVDGYVCVCLCTHTYTYMCL